MLEIHYDAFFCRPWLSVTLGRCFYPTLAASTGSPLASPSFPYLSSLTFFLWRFNTKDMLVLINLTGMSDSPYHDHILFISWSYPNHIMIISWPKIWNLWTERQRCRKKSPKKSAEVYPCYNITIINSIIIATITTISNRVLAMPGFGIHLFLLTGSANVARGGLQWNNFLPEVKCWDVKMPLKIFHKYVHAGKPLDWFNFRMATPPPTYDEHIEYKAYSKESLI